MLANFGAPGEYQSCHLAILVG